MNDYDPVTLGILAMLIAMAAPFIIIFFIIGILIEAWKVIFS